MFYKQEPKGTLASVRMMAVHLFTHNGFIKMLKKPKDN